MTTHLFISNTGLSATRFDEAFPRAKVITFGDVVKTNAAVVWLKLDHLEPAKPQIDWLKNNYPDVKFVVLSHIPIANEAMMSLSSGAKAYVNVHAGPETFKQIASVVMEGGVWLGEDLMQFLILALGQNRSNQDRAKAALWKEKLSLREIEVVEHVARGASNKVVARELDISDRTVKAHLTAIFEKLNVPDRLKLVLLVNDR